MFLSDLVKKALVSDQNLTDVESAASARNAIGAFGAPDIASPEEAAAGTSQKLMTSELTAAAIATQRHHGYTIHTVAGGNNYTVTNYAGRVEFHSTSFSAAMNYALEHAGYRGRIHLSGGTTGSVNGATTATFWVDEKIEIDRSVIITGDGDNVTRVYAAAEFDDDWLFDVGPGSFLGSIVIFDGIRFSGNGNSAGIIRFGKVTQPKVLNSGFFSFGGDGIQFNNSGFTYSARVTNCELLVSVVGGVGVRVNRSSDLIISENTFRLTHASWVNPVYGVVLGENANLVSVHSNAFIRSGGVHAGVRATGGTGASIVGNAFTDWTSSHSPIQFAATAAHTFNAYLADNTGPAGINTSTGTLINVNEHSNGVAIGPNLASGFAGGLYSASAPLAHYEAGITPTQTIGAAEIDWSAGNVFQKTLSENTTFTFAHDADGQTIVVCVTNTGSNYTVAWPAVQWPSGASPVQTVGAKTDVYTFIKRGSVIFGAVSQNHHTP